MTSFLKPHATALMRSSGFAISTHAKAASVREGKQSTVSVARVFIKGLALALALCLAPLAQAGTFTVGVPNSGGTNLDTCPSCDYIVNNAFHAGYTLTSYNFIAGQTGDITPLLLTRTDNGGHAFFTVVGVGTQQTGVTAGAHDFTFGLTSGTAQTSATSYFGFASSSPLVNFAYSTGNGGVFFSNPQMVTVGDTFDGGETSRYLHDSLGGVNDRTYSIQAVATTPEPSSLALLGTGIAGISGLLKRRSQRA